jgi:hypothetical protein
MKIKLIALAVAALVSGAANAAIDAGSTGNGNLLFTAWDSNSSYTLNTGYNFTTFQSAVTASTAGTNFYNFSDALLTNWLSTANAAEVKWTIFATDISGAQRTLTTSQTGTAGAKMFNDQVTAMNTAGNLFIDQNLNTGPFSGAAVDAVSLSSTTAYTGTSGFAFGDPLYAANFNSNGTLANNSAATGLSVIRVDAINTDAAVQSTYFQYNRAQAPVVAYLGADKSFHIGAVAAVPEADSLAMLLAGMGLVGSIARRRNRKTA